MANETLARFFTLLRPTRKQKADGGELLMPGYTLDEATEAFDNLIARRNVKGVVVLE
jgi:hypothetical protein